MHKLLLALLAILGWLELPNEASAADALPTTHWVWNRTSPLRTSEGTALRAQGVQELYWNIGTLTPAPGGWRGAEKLSMPQPPEGMRFVPVLRLHEGATTLGDDTANDRLIPLVQSLCSRFTAQAIQLDYDCPDRLLPRYAAILSRCRSALAPARLSATALAHWPRLDGYAALCASVDELMPMFYDLESATRVPFRDNAPPSLADPKRLAEWMRGWKNCPIPWRAGLPNFTRLTLLDTEGRSLGHLPEWRWETLVFHPALKVTFDTHDGTTLLAAEESGTVGRTPFHAGQKLLVRWSDPEVIRSAVKEAEKDGAHGIIFFKLPEPNAPGGWSLSQLSESQTTDILAPAIFSLTVEHSHLTLVNLSAMDLPPRFPTLSQPDDRGWTLELKGAPGLVQEAAPGGFAQVEHARVPDGEIWRFHFAWLRAADRLESGFFQLFTNDVKQSLLWRVPQISPVWNSLGKTSP